MGNNNNNNKKITIILFMIEYLLLTIILKCRKYRCTIYFSRVKIISIKCKKCSLYHKGNYYNNKLNVLENRIV